jgi:hypothetical protein
VLTLKKAIKILDWLIEQENKLSQGFVDVKKSWNQDFDCARDLAKSLSDSKRHEIETLQIIKNELIPNCSHPKDMQDVDSNGNRYCMDCNWDL